MRVSLSLCFALLLAAQDVIILKHRPPAGGGGPTSTNRVLWLNASDADKLYTTYSPCNTNPSDGQSVICWDDEDAADVRLNGGSHQPTYKTSGINGLGSVTFPATKFFSVQNDAFSANLTFDYIASASAFTIFIAFRITSDCTNNGTIYGNSGFMADGGGYFAIVCKTSGGTTSVHAYNWDGSTTTVSVNVSQNTDYVLMVRHASGNLYISVNGGSENSIASGNTSSLNSDLSIGTNQSQTNSLPGWIGEIICYDAAISSSDITTNISYLTAKW